MKKFVLGIAGHIGSGKTHAGKFFEKHGALFINADDVVNELYAQGADGYRKVISFFGDEYAMVSGDLNRKKLAKIVFGDPKKLRILNDLIHPLVTASIQKKIDKSAHKLIVVEATYFEKKYLMNLISAILWIECEKAVLFERVSKRQKITRDLFEKIIRFQQRPQNVYYIVVNSGTLASFEEQLLRIRQTL